MTSSSGRELSDPAISTLLRLGLSEDDPGGWPLAPEDVQRRFDELVIGELLGRGASGAVYRAVDRQTRRPYALKIISPALMTRPELAARFAREADAMRRLEHPAIARVYESGERGGLFFLRMQYVDGESLRTVSTPVPAKVAVEIAIQVCEALSNAHQLGVVHRDIKPENILLDGHGRVTLVDFGVAKLHRRDTPWTLTGTDAVIGTPLYLSPEQIETPTVVDRRADLFSLGVVLYELLTGRLPIGRFVEPSRVADVPRALDSVVLRALAPDREQRFASADALRRALAASMRRGVVATLGRNRRRLTVCAALAASVAVLGFAARGQARDESEPTHATPSQVPAQTAPAPAEVQSPVADAVLARDVGEVGVETATSTPASDDTVGALMLAAADAEGDARWDDALGHYQAVLARKPSHAGARYGLGHAAFRAGAYKRASRALYRYIQDHPRGRDIGRAVYFAGLSLTKLGHCRNAMLYFDAANRSRRSSEPLRIKAREQLTTLRQHLDGSRPNPQLSCEDESPAG